MTLYRPPLLRSEPSPGLTGFGSGVTHQEFKALCDINCILRSFKATGVLPEVSGLVSMPCDSYLYGDFSESVCNPLNSHKNERDLASEALEPPKISPEGSPDSLQGEDQKQPSGEPEGVSGGVKAGAGQPEA